MDPADTQSLVMTLTSRCIGRGSITLPGRYRTLLTPGPVTATEAHGVTHHLTIEPNFILTGLQPLFDRHKPQPNDEVVLTPTGAPDTYRIQIVMKQRRPTANPPKPKASADASPVPSIPQRPERASLDRFKENPYVYGTRREPAEPQQKETITQREQVEPTHARSELDHADALPGRQAEVETASAPEALAPSEDKAVTQDEHAGVPAEEPTTPPASNAFAWREDIPRDEAFAAAEPEWQQTFSPLVPRLIAYLLRPDTPVVVQSSRMAEELHESPSAIDEAMTHVGMSPALQVSPLRQGVYRVNRTPSKE